MNGERLFELLPAVHRLRDAERGEPLRALIGLLELELERIRENIEELGESWFIETCPAWVVPYIGDLVGNRPLIEVVHGRRADVAKTLYYRRRKGTLPMLEELARDVTGWGAHAVEMMETLAWTQHVNHVRRSIATDRTRLHPRAVTRVGTALVRDGRTLDLLDGPFDRVAHTVDVRRAPAGMVPRGTHRPAARLEEGWYGPRRLGFFLWRLHHYPLENAPARRADAPNTHGWHFSALGASAPLFTVPRADRDPALQSTELNVRAPIRALAFRADVEDFRDTWLPQPPASRPIETEGFYGPNRSFHIVADGTPLEPERLLCKDLGAWARPPAGRVGVDVRRGRISFAAGEEPEEVTVNYAYGFSDDIGGGPYDRRDSLADPAAAEWGATVGKGTAVDTLQQALTLWNDAGRPPGVIEISDNGVYGGALEIALPVHGALTIQAAQGRFPSIRTVGNLVVEALDDDSTLTMNGLLFESSLELRGSIAVELNHCTLVPGRMLDGNGEPWFGDRDAIVVGPGDAAPRVTVHRTIIGAIRLPPETRMLEVGDSIVHGLAVGGVVRPAIAADDTGAIGPPTRLERVTVFGSLNVRELHASDVLFTEPVTTQRTQSGCVRFSHVPDGSRTPRRFRCQPDLALEDVTGSAQRERVRQRLAPRFTATRFGDPAYAQLHHSAAGELRTGASNGSEMGAFNRLMQPQREANLQTRLGEYMPFGLEAGLIYVT